MKRFNLCTLSIGLAAVCTFMLVGCGQRANQGDPSQVPETSRAEHGHDGHGHGAEPTHGGWWCYEHGVPEAQCAMCDTKLAAELREKGDWCDEHNRPDSLCFSCHPENAKKFVALYEAKYGEKPPEPTE